MRTFARTSLRQAFSCISKARLIRALRAKKGDCHPISARRTALFPASVACENRWLSPFFRVRLSAGILTCLTVLAVSAPAQFGDAQRGAQVLRSRQCTVCHSVLGVGGTAGPDLGRRSLRQFTPAVLAASIWNHGPRMWRAMSERGIEIPLLTQRDVGDLYAYFYSLRYFEPLGDAARGRRVFQAKSCDRCHSLTKTGEPGIGPAVLDWDAVFDSILWIQEMWNHGARMAEAMEREGIEWPKFSTQEIVDLMVYVRNIPYLPHRVARLELGRVESGARVFRDHGCAQCHFIGEESGEESGGAEKGPRKIDLLAASGRAGTLSSLAVSMWNHLPLMSARAKSRAVRMTPFEGEEMGHLLAFLFDRLYFDVPGRPRRGMRIFARKNCGACHGAPGSDAPALRDGEGSFSLVGLTAAVWRHGPAMLAEMQSKGFAWPEFTPAEMADLVAFLNSPE